MIIALPRLASSERALRFRLGRWLSPRTTSLRGAIGGLGARSACWLVRAVAVFLLLGTLGVDYLTAARPALPLRRRRRCGAADRPCRCRCAGRRRGRSSHLHRCRRLRGARRLRLGRRARGLLRCCDHRGGDRVARWRRGRGPLAAAPGFRSLKGASPRWFRLASATMCSTRAARRSRHLRLLTRSLDGLARRRSHWR